MAVQSVMAMEKATRRDHWRVGQSPTSRGAGSAPSGPARPRPSLHQHPAASKTAPVPSNQAVDAAHAQSAPEIHAAPESVLNAPGPWNWWREHSTAYARFPRDDVTPGHRTADSSDSPDCDRRGPPRSPGREASPDLTAGLGGPTGTAVKHSADQASGHPAPRSGCGYRFKGAGVSDSIPCKPAAHRPARRNPPCRCALAQGIGGTTAWARRAARGHSTAFHCRQRASR